MQPHEMQETPMRDGEFEPFYLRLIPKYDGRVGYLYGQLEQDLHWRLSRWQPAEQSAQKPAPIRPSPNGHRGRLLVNMIEYGMAILGQGTTAGERRMIEKDIRDFEHYLQTKLRRAEMDFSERLDSDVPKGRLLILSDEQGVPTLGMLRSDLP